VEGRKLRAIAAHVRSSDAWVVPTLYLWENRSGPADLASRLSLPEMRYVPMSTREAWLRESGSRSPTDPETAALLVEVRQRIVRALTMAGVGVLMGTDSPQMFNVPGFSLRHELRSMEGAGLTPYEILVTGTRSVAEYAQRELLEPANFGTVVAGNRADLLLLRADPRHVEELCLLEPGYRPHVMLGRFDSYWSGRRIRFLELNANGASMWCLAELLDEEARELPELGRIIARHGAEGWPLTSRMFDGLVHAWRGARGTERLPRRIAIVDWDGVSTSSEQRRLAGHFTTLGVPTDVVHPSDLAFDGSSHTSMSSLEIRRRTVARARPRAADA